MRVFPEKVWKAQCDPEEKDWFEKVAYMAKETGEPQAVYIGEVLFATIWPSGAMILPTIRTETETKVVSRFAED
jgi:hypothetical protein